MRSALALHLCFEAQNEHCVKAMRSVEDGLRMEKFQGH